MSQYTGARVMRSYIQPSPSMRKALNKSLVVKPNLSLTSTELSYTPTLRAGVIKQGSAVYRSGIPGELAAYQQPRAFIRGAGTDGYQVWRALNGANRIMPSVPPGQKATPIPPAGFSSSGNPQAPMTGSLGVQVSGSTLLLGVVAALLFFKR